MDEVNDGGVEIRPDGEEGGGGNEKHPVVEQKQEVWSWGAGTDGQHGTGCLQDEHLPRLLFLPPSYPQSSFSLLSCGGAHVIALTTEGRVLTWGRGTSGQLGHGEKQNCLQPKLVTPLQNFRITHISAGWSHSGFVSDTGRLFNCGDGSFGQLGHGDFTSLCSPVEVLYFSSMHVEQIAYGMRHSLVLLRDSEDQVYSFGSGKHGQLGVSLDKRLTALPQATLGLKYVKIVSICANGDHSAALSADGHFYTWGRGFSGESDACCPQCLNSSLQFIQAALGWNHALLLTGDGEVFMYGGNLHGLLNDPEKLSSQKLLSEEPGKVLLFKVPGLDCVKVVNIAAGAEHSALVTDSGLIKTWGWGEHGQLGLGNTADQTIPQTVHLDHGSFHNNGYTVFKIYCGSGFTYAVRTP